MLSNPQELISTLKIQHRALQADLSIVQDELTKGLSVKTDTVILALTKFRNDLIEHLKLENNEFYPDYLDKKAKRGEDVSSTRDFIKQMEDIGKTVMLFLDTYDNSAAVNTNLTVFSKALNGVISVLNTRIETEEEGVFGLYLLL